MCRTSDGAYICREGQQVWRCVRLPEAAGAEAYDGRGVARLLVRHALGAPEVFEQEVEVVLRGLVGQLVQQLLGRGGLTVGWWWTRKKEKEKESGLEKGGYGLTRFSFPAASDIQNILCCTRVRTMPKHQIVCPDLSLRPVKLHGLYVPL